MILGLMAPELVVWNAWRQRKDAKYLSSMMRHSGFMAQEKGVWQRIRIWFEAVSTSIQVFLLLKAGEGIATDRSVNKPQNGRSHFWTDVLSSIRSWSLSLLEGA